MAICTNCSNPVSQSDLNCMYCDAPLQSQTITADNQVKRGERVLNQDRDRTPNFLGRVARNLSPTGDIEFAKTFINSKRRNSIILYLFAGALIGGLLGFLLRPSVPLIGQLDFNTVISRGSNLRGVNQILVSTARDSFNILVGGIIIGAIIGGVIGNILLRKQSDIKAPSQTKLQEEDKRAKQNQAEISGSIIENISKLAELKNAGILTEEEFQVKKEELLKRI